MSITDLLYCILGLWNRFVTSQLWFIAFIPIMCCAFIVAIIQLIKYLITLGE